MLPMDTDPFTAPLQGARVFFGPVPSTPLRFVLGYYPPAPPGRIPVGNIGL